MVVCAALDSVRLARSQAVRRRRSARGLSEMSFLFLRLNSCGAKVAGREGFQGGLSVCWRHQLNTLVGYGAW